ncbi:Bestrophin, RFP-TM, chloride channel-domain-containing protein [Chytriomyces cf. hyalinus JEL632]|nr:Bestrophin, RFP-TM, chloride channel-domain-containing protein [Chytriomyces cf. hyalinus JEL632]
MSQASDFIVATGSGADPLPLANKAIKPTLSNKQSHSTIASSATLFSRWSSLDTNRHLQSLSRKAETKRRTNIVNSHWRDLLRVSLSALPLLWRQLIIVAIWSTAVCLALLLPVDAFQVMRVPLNSMPFVAVTTITLNLLLAFRNNAAYDRFWEGRKLWSQMRSNIANFSRYAAAFDKTSSLEEDLAKQNAIRLLPQFANAVKDSLRFGVTRSSESSKSQQHALPFLHTSIPPADIIMELQQYLTPRPIMKLPSQGPFLAILSALVEQAIQLQRIKTTPPPAAYTIHLKQVLIIYLISIPFTLVRDLRWLTILVTPLVAFVLLGILLISAKLEDPFGEDAVDLRMDEYVADIEETVELVLLNMVRSDEAKRTLDWIEPCSVLNAFNKGQF